MHAQRLFASLLVCLGLLSSGTAMSETIQVSIDGKSYPVKMADNADARAFIARLPMTLTFENFGRNERIAYPKPALELERDSMLSFIFLRHFEITRGTMTVYKPWGNIAIFLVEFPWSSDLADLGQISPEGLEAIRTSGDKTVTFLK